MSRRSRRGRDISGWLPVDKPAGRTSFELVQEAKTALSAQKAGHAGTLDRPATGVLAIAFGDATKTISFITDLPKTYLFTVTFGQATETDDAQGEVIASSEKRPTDEEILDAMEAFPRGHTSSSASIFRREGRRHPSLQACSGRRPDGSGAEAAHGSFLPFDRKGIRRSLHVRVHLRKGRIRAFDR